VGFGKGALSWRLAGAVSSAWLLPLLLMNTALAGVLDLATSGFDVTVTDETGERIRRLMLLADAAILVWLLVRTHRSKRWRT